jgi:hypothetical protein
VETNGFDQRKLRAGNLWRGPKGPSMARQCFTLQHGVLAEWSCVYSNKKKKGKTTTKYLKKSIAMVETHHFVYIIFPCNQVCKVVIQGGS